MESANREEAKRCLLKAQDAFKGGDVSYAKKLALKSLKLCYTFEAQGRLNEIASYLPVT